MLGLTLCQRTSVTATSFRHCRNGACVAATLDGLHFLALAILMLYRFMVLTLNL